MHVLLDEHEREVQMRQWPRGDALSELPAFAALGCVRQAASTLYSVDGLSIVLGTNPL